MAEDIEDIRKRRLKQMQKEFTSQPVGRPVEVSDDSFADFMKQHPKAVVDFWAPWCGPCKMLAPTLDELAKELESQVAFGKVNVDDNQQTAAKFGVMSIPTLIFFENGVKVDSVTGASSKEQLKNKIAETFKL